MSVKSRIWEELVYSGRSLMNKRKRIGLRTDRCGTPLMTGKASDSVLSMTTLCNQLDRKELIHFLVS